MPQLNPTPWLAILLFTWLMFSTMIPPKVMSCKQINEPNLLTVKMVKATPWNWKWY
uniref:ATP synthase F0 subunit 8 n=1 Tax=Hippocampus nalu TaxID=2744974 RepID=UPI001BF14ECE|nr:ATP synthase F0 subunit 8 [Hippocampus nalu]QKV49102.1 ATP synthase F0 subunit 8 [Hippocampus nalu]